MNRAVRKFNVTLAGDHPHARKAGRGCAKQSGVKVVRMQNIYFVLNHKPAESHELPHSVGVVKTCERKLGYAQEEGFNFFVERSLLANDRQANVVAFRIKPL